MTRIRKTTLGAAVAAAVFTLAGAVHARSASTQELSIVNAQGQTIPATLYVPAGGQRGPAVIMMPGCSTAANGAPEAYDAWAERLTAAGYVALLLNSDKPRAASARCDHSPVGLRERAADAEGAHRFLADRGLAAADRIGLIGWSEGASGAPAAVAGSQAHGGASLFKAAVVFQPDCRLGDAFGGVARSTWKPYASVRVVQDESQPRGRDWNCIQRIARAQQLGATSVSLVTRHEGGERAGAPAAQRAAQFEVIDLLNGALGH